MARYMGGELMLVLIVAAFILVPLLLLGFALVSIIWTHRPELSLGDILREAMHELFNNTKAGTSGGKETENENHNL